VYRGRGFGWILERVPRPPAEQHSASTSRSSAALDERLWTLCYVHKSVYGGPGHWGNSEAAGSVFIGRSKRARESSAASRGKAAATPSAAATKCLLIAFAVFAVPVAGSPCGSGDFVVLRGR
jgi:hypothetical protein